MARKDYTDCGVWFAALRDPADPRRKHFHIYACERPVGHAGKHRSWATHSLTTRSQHHGKRVA